MISQNENLYQELLGGVIAWELFVPFTPLEKYKGFIQEEYNKEYVLKQVERLNNVLNNVVKLFVVDKQLQNENGVYIKYVLKDDVKEYALEWKNEQNNDDEVIAKQTYDYAKEMHTMLKRNIEYFEFQPIILMSQTNISKSDEYNNLKEFQNK